jgi:hypothetical protein
MAPKQARNNVDHPHGPAAAHTARQDAAANALLLLLLQGEYSVGVITQAVEQVAAQGVSYFGAAGNYDGSVWEASAARWTRSGNRTLHNFGTAAAPNAFLEFYMFGSARFYLHVRCC